jgi:hypothetical protein
MNSNRYQLLPTTALFIAAICLTADLSQCQTPQPVLSIRSYLGKCLEYGSSPPQAGAPIYASVCGNTAQQQLQIVEVDSQHHVLLYAGSFVIGVKTSQNITLPNNGIGTISAVTSSQPAPGSTLELQNKANAFLPPTPSSPVLANQLFSLDGDSIILASNQDLVVQVQGSNTADRTPLVMGTRDLKDSEFWTFSAAGKPYLQLTSGFIFVSAGNPVPQEVQLENALHDPPEGTVIVLDPSIDITLPPSSLPLVVPEGVTIRGSRRGTNLGPRISVDTLTGDGTLFDTSGSHTRFTGLRLQGPSRGTDLSLPVWVGIQAHDNLPTIIDHNDISNWTSAGVEALNTEMANLNDNDPPSRPQTIRVVRNFIHHNERNNLGYGVFANTASFPLIEGNTFIMNRHAIAGSASAHTSYRALYNLVQSAAPEYSGQYNQDFDMHGDGPGKSNWPLSPCFRVDSCGGNAGEYIEITGNTFLGTNRPSFFLRGTPTWLAVLNQNVFMEPQNLEVVDNGFRILTGAIKNAGASDKLLLENNQFSAPNPTTNLGAGDFDGDKLQDLFLATGQAWYFAPAGAAEWRFLSAKTETLANLLFGDFDGDGRTDVIAKNGNDVMVSWGGVSDWQNLNSTAAQITDLAIGDFDGDGRADIFYGYGTTWFISSGGSGPFTAVQTSSFRVSSLRFGDLNGDGQTDVFAIEGGKWHVSYSATSFWIPLPESLTSTVNGVVIADFDGDGRADVAASSLVPVLGWEWMFSNAGESPWTFRTSPSQWWSIPLSSAIAIGSFDTGHGADVLLWGSTLGSDHISIVSGGSLKGSAEATPQSRQDMR